MLSVAGGSLEKNVFSDTVIDRFNHAKCFNNKNAVYWAGLEKMESILQTGRHHSNRIIFKLPVQMTFFSPLWPRWRWTRYCIPYNILLEKAAWFKLRVNLFWEGMPTRATTQLCLFSFIFPLEKCQFFDIGTVSQSSCTVQNPKKHYFLNMTDRRR